MQKKLGNLIKELNKGLIEREEIIKLSLLGIIAGENSILIGPPGTAKSEISRRMAQVVDNAEYYEYLLTNFTTPEEIFGPLSIKELKNDKFQRKTDGYLPKANIAFLDEIFKANSSILNSLLTIINEKKFHNGNIREDAPLISLIGASNELPLGDEELNALYDRFLIRLEVNYISDNKIDSLFDLEYNFGIPKELKLSIEELKVIKEGAKNIEISTYIKEMIKEIRVKFHNEFIEDINEVISDRRFIKILNLLRVSAYINGRSFVNMSDLVLLNHCLWNNPKNKNKISNIIKKAIL